MSHYDKKNKLWSRLVQNPPGETIISPGQRALDYLSMYGSKVQQINDETGVQTTYAALRLRTISCAQNLLKRGIQPREVFGFMVEHADHLAPVMLAALCLGCPIAPLHPMLSKDEIIRILMKTKPSIMFCDVSACCELTEALKELPFKVKIFTFGGQIECFEPVESLFVETGEEDSFVPVSVNKDTDVYAMFCSSGTTGPSKCFCLQYDRCKLMHPSKHEPNSVMYCPDAIYWTAGTRPLFHSIPNGAKCVISTAPFTPELPLKLIEKYGVTILFIATYDLIACLKTDLVQTADLISVKKILTSGSQTPRSLVSEVHRYFPNASLTSWYGTSEVGVMCDTHFENGQIESGGELYTGCTAKIIDDDENRCGPNECGEVCLKCTPSFLHYVDDPEATAALIDDEGFFRTGDIGYFDDRGQLFIKDRKKNLFTVFYFDGVLVPFELEEYLINMPGIEEVCVVGVPIADGASLPASVVKPKLHENLSKNDVFQMIADHFPKRLWLRAGVYFVESFPKTGSGKLVRREITKIAQKMFENAKQSDPDIQSYVADIPEAFRKLIWL